MFIIAEIAQAHDGSLGILHSYIDALAKTGVDAVKFQIHIAEAESSEYEPFRVNFSYEDKSRFDYWKRTSFTKDQWKEVKKHCEEVGLEFMASPFSQAAVELLEDIGVKRYKIGSGEVNNKLLLRKVAETQKPIILSSGMSSFAEIEDTVNFLKPFENQLSILQCTTAYPTPPEKLGLNVLVELKEKFPGVTIGLSEHTGEIYAGIAAAAIGAEILEFHVVFDKRMFGPDAQSSLTIDQTISLVKGVSAIKTTINNPINKNDNSEFSRLKMIFEKSIAVNKAMKKGDVIKFEDLETKKPKGYGINASQYESILGKTLARDLEKYDFLNLEDLK